MNIGFYNCSVNKNYIGGKKMRLNNINFNAGYILKFTREGKG